jgi:hypothetical protein
MQDKNWIVVFTTDLNDDTVLDPVGPLKNGTMMFGWKDSEKNAALFQNLVLAGNIKGLWAIEGSHLVVATCQMYCQMPFDGIEAYDADELAELKKFDRKFVDALLRAKSSYTLHAGKSVPSITFSRIVWETTAGLVGGMIDDPQEGRWKTITAAEQGEQAAVPGSIASSWIRNM